MLSRLNNAVSADDGQYLRPGIESNKEGRENFHHGFSRTEGRKESVYVDTRGRRSEFVGPPKFFFYTAALQSTGSCLITKTIDKTGAKCLPLRFPPGREL